jgi:hypothetical protein
LRSEITKLQDGVTQVLSLLDSIASGNVDRDDIRRIRQGNTVDGIVRSLGIHVGGANGQINLQEKLLELAGRGLDPEPDDPDGQSLDSGSEGTRDASVSDTRSRPPYTSNESSSVHIKVSNSPPLPPSPLYANLPHRTLSSSSTAANAPPPPPPPPQQSFYHSPSGPAVTEPGPSPAFPPHSVYGSSTSPYPSPPTHQQYALDTQWSSIIEDPQVLDNMLNMYFAWEQPGYSTICKEPFLKDFKARRRRFASEALTNSIMSRVYQMIECSGTPVAEGLVDGLYRRAQAQLSVERSALETPYPYIQTLTVLATIDIVIGRLDAAWEWGQQSARLAIIDALEGNNSSVDEEYRMVKANTFCGTICLPWLLRVVSRRLDPMEAPQFMRIYADAPETPEDRIERGVLLQKHYHAALPHCPFRSRFIWEITEIAHTFLMFHFDEPSIAQGKKDLFETYPRLIECLEKASAELGTDDLTPAKTYSL